MALAYTFTQKTPPAEPNQESNFGGMPVDANHMAMLVGAGPQTTDATGTPVTSPTTVSSATTTTLNIPVDAIQVSFIASTNPVNVSEADSTVASKYFTIPTGIVTTIDVSRTAVLYLKANAISGSSTLSFWFNVV